MGRVRRKGNFAKNKSYSKTKRTRNYKRDWDQIQDDLKPENTEKLTNQPVDENLPGLGQHYCITCARYFVTRTALDIHIKSKLHKQNIKRSKEVVHTQKDSEEFGKF